MSEGANERSSHTYHHQGWIGVDLDGTLAHYGDWKGAEFIGEPIPVMVHAVKTWLADGVEVRIMTARVSGPVEDAEYARTFIEKWAEEHIGQRLRVTCVKDYGMRFLLDDRALQVAVNTGLVITRDGFTGPLEAKGL